MKHTIFSFHGIAIDHLAAALEAGIGDCADIDHLVLGPVHGYNWRQSSKREMYSRESFREGMLDPASANSKR